MGEVPIPEVPVKANVRDFGAKGDGVTDDSQAFLDAIAAVNSGAIYIPEGRYRITRVVQISKSNVVLRGAGRDATVLYFPKPLSDILGGRRDFYSWHSGVIWFKGQETGTKLADVTTAAFRGDQALTVSSNSAVQAGQMVRLTQSDPGDGSLARHLNADQVESGIKLWDGRLLVDFATRVEAVEAHTLFLERPLRTDVRAAWSPEIHTFKPSVQDAGIEDLTIEFPEVKYPGHHKERGYNAIYFETIANSWIRNIKILNADSGIFLQHGSRFCTVQGVYLAAYRGRARRRKTDSVSGHYAFQAGEYSYDNLFTEFTIDTNFIHDLTVFLANGNVFSSGSGVEISLDHHKMGPYENLYTDINVGAGNRVWFSGGTSKTAGTHSSARATFWNIQSQKPISWPPARSYDGLPWGPDQMNLVGLTTKDPTIKSHDGRWFEAIHPAQLRPQNLHLAQLERRLGGRHQSHSSHIGQ